MVRFVAGACARAGPAIPNCTVKNRTSCIPREMVRPVLLPQAAALSGILIKPPRCELSKRRGEYSKAEGPKMEYGNWKVEIGNRSPERIAGTDFRISIFEFRGSTSEAPLR